MNLFNVDEEEKKSFGKIMIRLCSPDTILARSHGEVLKPETMNYRSYKPEKYGLFCEKIFGPVKDWECHCGKYKGIRYKAIVCDRCGVEITKKEVRRRRLGHITLAVPVVHIWYFRSIPSKIGYILDISPKDLERIIYYESYVVINPGTTGLLANELIPEEEYVRIMEEFGPENEALPDDDKKKFIARIGGEAILDLLRRVDIELLSSRLRREILTETSLQRKSEKLKRLKVIEAFKASGNRPEWMVLTILPVLAPDLRPLVPLEGGRFATSDLNDLYRRVIIRNNRLKSLQEIRAPEVILRNEKRMLQESVDSLFDNGRGATAVLSTGKRPLKSLSDSLRGKQGRFRQNLLGKRVDYSGRSVIVVGPELKLGECGLPKDMAVELFKPFIIRKLIESEQARTVKNAKRIVERKTEEVWGILEEIIKDHPVLLNRAPTLHRLGIQAFQPILIEGKAIRLHPLVCAAFNADFDGDQMAVHIPLSYEAQIEAKLLMMATQNLLNPANGRPIAVPSQDMVLGCYYLTKSKHKEPQKIRFFSSIEECIVAYNEGVVDLHIPIRVRINGEFEETTTGRVIFNSILPSQIKKSRFYNEVLTKKRVEEIALECYLEVGNGETALFLDRLKDLGFYYATVGGLSIGLDDIEISVERKELITQASRKVESIQRQYERRVITDGERYNQIIDLWTHTTSEVSRRMMDSLRVSQGGFNPVFMMADSGARGSQEQIRQLAGMRGLMAKPQKTMTGQKGEIIESPITANFKDGLSVLEYFISTHGARKGLADTALKTADAGYLTRRLVDVAQDMIVREEDCDTILGIEIGAIKDGEEVREPLFERILGRVLAQDVHDPVTGETLGQAGQLITYELAEKISATVIDKVKIRSVLACESRRGVCVKCYGTNLTTSRLAVIGDAVGVMAAQSIGEPGTQLTLRTFHIGGTASRIATQSFVVAKDSGTIHYENLLVTNPQDEKFVAMRRNGQIKIFDENNRMIAKYTVPYGATIFKGDGAKVSRGEVIFNWDPYSVTILSQKDGVAKFVDIREGVTFREEVDDTTGLKLRFITDSRAEKISPHILILDKKGKKIDDYIIPTGAHLVVNDGDTIRAGDIVAKIPRDISKTRDITGGLPRVAELFEARRPKDQAVVSEIDGVVKFGSLKRGVREIMVHGKGGHEKRSYLIPYGKHILVHDGDEVFAGEKLTEGSIAPHDILEILGPGQVQSYLVNEIQEVYRLQGVKINDKHIEVIVRQMLQKVKIDDPGDTGYLEGDRMDAITLKDENDRILTIVVVEEPGDSKFSPGQLIRRLDFNRENKKLKDEGKAQAKGRRARPAIFQPVLLGITQASLNTESFISAASFQETTRVLTDAAISGKVDRLLGLKENVIIGHLIPAGTGLAKFQRLKVQREFPEEEEETDEEEETGQLVNKSMS